MTSFSLCHPEPQSDQCHSELVSESLAQGLIDNILYTGFITSVRSPIKAETEKRPGVMFDLCADLYQSPGYKSSS